jgi:hypothetical protein
MHSQFVNFALLNENLESYKKEFATAEPFQHIVIDNAFHPYVLDLLLREFDEVDWSKQDVRNDEGIQVKLRSDWKKDDDVPLTAGLVIDALNSGDFLRWLSKLTGIQGIIADQYLSGGGFNQINRGGLLAVHADGNWHDLMAVHRRLNIIVYLNKDWESEWGGDFELWDRERTHCVKKVMPIFNRMVIFKTDDFSMHGHPTPLACPEDRSRRSLILYYYTNTRPSEELASDEKHRAQFYKTNQDK